MYCSTSGFPVLHHLLEVKWSEVAQLCPTLCDPMDCNLPGSSVHGIFQARILEWVAISFSRGSSRPRDRTQVSCLVGRRFTIWARPSLGAYSNSCPLSHWCHPTILSSVTPFFCLQSFPAAGSFPMSRLFMSSGHRTGDSASASVFPMNISGLFSFRIDWFDLLAVQGTLRSLLQSLKALIL